MGGFAVPYRVSGAEKSMSGAERIVVLELVPLRGEKQFKTCMLTKQDLGSSQVFF